jgi:hypothetical protein
LPNAPSTLCGFPTVTQGRAGLPVSLRACRTCTCRQSYFQACPAWFQLSWLTSQARYVRVQVPLGRHKARCVAVRLLMPPVENRTDHFHGIRLSTCGLSPCAHEAFLPISPAPQYIPRGQLARSLGTSGPVFPQARGLRHGADAPCARLSRAPTTTPHPPLPEALEFRWALAYLLPTLLRILRQLPVFPMEDSSKTR